MTTDTSLVERLGKLVELLHHWATNEALTHPLSTLLANASIAVSEAATALGERDKLLIKQIAAWKRQEDTLRARVAELEKDKAGALEAAGILLHDGHANEVKVLKQGQRIAELEAGLTMARTLLYEIGKTPVPLAEIDAILSKEPK